MANRVVLGALPGGGYGLRVSRPGFNVLDMGLAPNQLSFDSRWSGAAKVHMAGYMSSSGLLYYGRSFPVCPLVTIAYTDNQGRYRTLKQQGFVQGNNQGTYEGVSTVKVYPDRCDIRFGGSSYYVVYV